jgi:hypothetical protein
MDIISPFDPWNDPFCTCPPKYSLNPYTVVPMDVSTAIYEENREYANFNVKQL